MRSKGAGDYKKRYFTYEDTICLEKGSTYSFVINDAYEDGLTFGDKGFYSLTLNDKEIARETDYGSKSSKTITTESTPTKAPTPKPTKKPTPKPIAPKPTKKPTSKPTHKPTSGHTPKPVKRGPCTNRPGWEFNNIKGQTCDAIFLGDLGGSTRNKKCNEKDPSRERRIKHFCPAYCRKKCRRVDSKTNEMNISTLDGKMMKRQVMNMKMNRSRSRNMNRKRDRKRKHKRQVKTEFVSRI